MKRHFTIIILFYSSLSLAQNIYAPLDNDYNSLIDRLDIKGYSGKIFTSVKPYSRKEIAALADSLSKDSTIRFSKVDKQNLQYLRDDNWEWSNVKDSGNSKRSFIWNLYKKKNAFYEVNKPDFQMQVNPVIEFSYGKDNDAPGLGKAISQSTYINTRGGEIEGTIDKRVSFYTMLTDNQAAFPQYVSNYVGATSAVPGEGFWKPFKTNGYDFYSFEGYIDFNFTKHISTQFGQGKNFIGDGYRSLFLSDFSSNYLYWKIDTKVWKFDYINVFAQMTADIILTPSPAPAPQGDVAYPHKYMALHYLSYNVSKKLNLSFFECITFGNTDSVHNRGFDPSYLNPIIFYKAVENGMGAPDKDHIGFSLKWNLLNHFSLYGSVILDEFNLDEIKAGNGWWGNKQGGQIGVKWVDIFGIHNLDGQLEENFVPPYTYATYSFSKSTNYSYYANYTNYQQPLADPLGANFYETIGILRFQPYYKWSFTGKLFYDQTGLDILGLNYGSNIMLSNTTRVQDYNNFIGQGAKTTILYLSFTATYKLAHNMFIDATAIIRNEQSVQAQYTNDDKTFSVSFRWNIAKRLQEF
ncbi:MAG TPA: hypothetical protein VK806_09550 [Bacteroidia bacterium]|jgi:hypothetical protein|nr:hypothetical protein [Bacteroidia bacterium]